MSELKAKAPCSFCDGSSLSAQRNQGMEELLSWDGPLFSMSGLFKWKRNKPLPDLSLHVVYQWNWRRDKYLQNLSDSDFLHTSEMLGLSIFKTICGYISNAFCGEKKIVSCGIPTVFLAEKKNWLALACLCSIVQIKSYYHYKYSC